MLRARKSESALSLSVPVSAPAISTVPLARRVDAADEVQKRGLAAARGPHHHGEAVGRDLEADALDGGHFDAAGAIGLGDVAQADDMPFHRFLLDILGTISYHSLRSYGTEEYRCKQKRRPDGRSPAGPPPRPRMGRLSAAFAHSPCGLRRLHEGRLRQDQHARDRDPRARLEARPLCQFPRQGAPSSPPASRAARARCASRSSWRRRRRKRRSRRRSIGSARRRSTPARCRARSRPFASPSPSRIPTPPRCSTRRRARRTARRSTISWPRRSGARCCGRAIRVSWPASSCRCLWGDLLMRLLLRAGPAPGDSEIERRAREATRILLLLHGTGEGGERVDGQERRRPR